MHNDVRYWQSYKIAWLFVTIGRGLMFLTLFAVFFVLVALGMRSSNLSQAFVGAIYWVVGLVISGVVLQFWGFLLMMVTDIAVSNAPHLSNDEKIVLVGHNPTDE